MTHAARRIDSTSARLSADPDLLASKPFGGLLDAVLVEQALPFPSAGCIAHSDAVATWRYVVRDLCPDLIGPERLANGTIGAVELEGLMGAVAARLRDAVISASGSPEATRRLRAQLGGEPTRAALPVLLTALQGRSLLAKAQALGNAINIITDDAALGSALASLPLGDRGLAGLLFHALLTHVAQPGRLMTAAIRLSGGAGEGALVRAGFGPLVDAHFSHAQVQVLSLQSLAGFADMDLACRRLERYHQLLRSLTSSMEFARSSSWSATLSGTVRMATERVESRLSEVVPDINGALRRSRDGIDRLDTDRMLAAINGVYLLAAIRDCRGSLALNALFDHAWTQSGEALDLHLKRNLELLHSAPTDPVIGARLDGAITMAEVRFNSAYAETLRRARTTTERQG